MKQKQYTFIGIVLLLLQTINTNLPAQNKDEYGQSNLTKDYVFLLGNAHKDTTVIKVLYENAPRYFNAPDMPRFAVIGKDRKFYLGIGGYVKASLTYDFGNPIESPLYFIPSNIPMNQAPGNGTLVQFGIGSSNLFFNFVALPHTKNQVGTYINFNFGGEDYGFDLQNAYIKYRGFTIGYGVSLFTDGSAATPTIDIQGPNAMGFVRNAFIDYRYTINPHLELGIGVELPNVNATYGSKSYGVNQRIPDIPAFVKYSYLNGTGWIRLTGLIRNMYYRNEVKNKTEDNIGWAAQLSGSIPFTTKVNLYYQGLYGKGNASYIQDMQGEGLDMVPVSNGELENVEAWGAYMGLQWQVCPKILTSATYSFVNSYLPNATTGYTGYSAANVYKRAQYIVTNVFYSITPSITWGLEYLYGSRTNHNGKYKQDSRLQTAFRVNF